MPFVIFMLYFLLQRKFILEVLGNGTVEAYGRDDLYDVFGAIKHFHKAKTCKSGVLFAAQTAHACGISQSPTSPR